MDSVNPMPLPDVDKIMITMSSGSKRMYEDIDEDNANGQVVAVEHIINEIRDIKPLSSKMDNFLWVADNYERIVRNKRLIELLG